MSSFQGFSLATVLVATGAVAIAYWGYISARRKKSSDPSVKPVQVKNKEELGSVPTQAAGKGRDPSIKSVQVVDKKDLGFATTQDAGKEADTCITPVHVVAKEELGFVPAQDVANEADLAIKTVQVVNEAQLCSLPAKDDQKGADAGIIPVQMVDNEELGYVPSQHAGIKVEHVEIKDKEDLCSLSAKDGRKGADAGIMPVQVVQKKKLGSVPAQHAGIKPEPGTNPVQMMDKEELCSMPAHDEDKGADVGIKPVQVMNKEELIFIQDHDEGKGVDLANESMEEKEDLVSILAKDGGNRRDTHLSKAYEDQRNERKLKQEDNGSSPGVSILLPMEGKVIDSDRIPLEKEVNLSTSEIQLKGKSSQVLVLGLDGSGKTSVLNSIAANKGKVITTPTEGVNAMCVSNGSSKMEFLEIGGSEQLRPYWKMYLSKAFAVIFVVDSADHSRLPLAKRHLHQLIQQDSVVPLIVLANKQDLGNAHHITDIHDALALSEICENRKLFLIGTHVTKGGDDISSGIQDAKEFLAQLQSV